MQLNANLAYKVTLPNGTTFYAAGIHALDVTAARPPVTDAPTGVFWYLMSSNTILGGYSFWATEFEPLGDSGTKFKARLYVFDGRFAPKPVVLQVVGRDQVEGDYEAPVEFTDAELEDQDLMQTLLVAQMVYDGFDQVVQEKVDRGYVVMNPS